MKKMLSFGGLRFGGLGAGLSLLATKARAHLGWPVAFGGACKWPAAVFGGSGGYSSASPNPQ